MLNPSEILTNLLNEKLRQEAQQRRTKELTEIAKEADFLTSSKIITLDKDMGKEFCDQVPELIKNGDGYVIQDYLRQINTYAARAYNEVFTENGFDLDKAAARYFLVVQPLTTLTDVLLSNLKGEPEDVPQSLHSALSDFINSDEWNISKRREKFVKHWDAIRPGVLKAQKSDAETAAVMAATTPIQFRGLFTTLLEDANGASALRKFAESGKDEDLLGFSQFIAPHLENVRQERAALEQSTSPALQKCSQVIEQIFSDLDKVFDTPEFQSAYNLAQDAGIQDQLVKTILTEQSRVALSNISAPSLEKGWKSDVPSWLIHDFVLLGITALKTPQDYSSGSSVADVKKWAEKVKSAAHEEKDYRYDQMLSSRRLFKSLNMLAYQDRFPSLPEINVQRVHLKHRLLEHDLKESLNKLNQSMVQVFQAGKVSQMSPEDFQKAYTGVIRAGNIRHPGPTHR